MLKGNFEIIEWSKTLNKSGTVYVCVGVEWVSIKWKSWAVLLTGYILSHSEQIFSWGSIWVVYDWHTYWYTF